MHSPDPRDLDRRQFIKTAAATALASGFTASHAASSPQRSSLIADENRRPGTTDWQLNRVRLSKAQSVRAPEVEGYCSKQSVLAGESLDIFVSTAPAARFKFEIFRTGYYGGCGARLLTTLGPFDGQPQLIPTPGAKRLVACTWTRTTTLKIPTDWPSGVYLGRLTTKTELPHNHKTFTPAAMACSTAVYCAGSQYSSCPTLRNALARVSCVASRQSLLEQ